MLVFRKGGFGPRGAVEMSPFRCTLPAGLSLGPRALFVLAGDIFIFFNNATNPMKCAHFATNSVSFCREQLL